MNPDYMIAILLGEMIFAVLVLITSLYMMSRYYRHRIEKIRTRFMEGGNQSAANGASSADSAEIHKFLTAQAMRSKQRYRQLSDSEAVNIDPNRPIPEQVAGMRSCYMEAECVAYLEQKNETHLWSILDRELKKIIDSYCGNKIVEKKINDQLQSRLALMQERIDKLQGTEDNRQEMEAELKQAQGRVNELHALRNVNRMNVKQLENLNRKMSIRGGSLTQDNKKDAYKVKFTPDFPPEKLISDIKGFSRRSSEEVDILKDKIGSQKDVISELKELVKNYELKLEISEQKAGRQGEAMKNLLKMEAALNESQNNALNLNYELNRVKGTLHMAEKELDKLNEQRAQQAGMVSDLRSSVVTAGDDNGGNGGYSIISKAFDKDEGDHLTPVAVEAMDSYSRTKAELDRLRESSSEQRHLIIELDAELAKLKEEMVKSEQTTEELEQKNKSINQLEKLLKESEDCIVVLESEIDRLHSELESLPSVTEGAQQENNPEDGGERENDEEIERLQQEADRSRELLDNALDAYDDQSRIIQFALNSGACDTFEKLAKELMDTVRVLGIGGCLQIRARNGEVEVSSSKIDQAERRQLNAAKPWRNDRFTDTADGFILTVKNMAFLAKSLPADKKKQARLKDTLNSIFTIASVTAEKLDHEKGLIKNRHTLKKLLGSTKKNIQQITVQNKYQADEANRIVNRLLKEMGESLKNVKLSDSQRIVFKNMMADCQERLALLFASGMVVDQSFSRLLENLERAE